MSAPIASVVIPAHNEEQVLGRCLDALLADARPGEFDVVVAANGCTDNTVAVATARRAQGVSVVTTEVASKIAALNLGDATASTFPRIYLDADVCIDTATARALACTLDEPSGPLAAAPRMRLDVSRSSRPARAYLDVWAGLPVFATGYVGSGCYALAHRGRGRFIHFPDVVGDDRFINAIFAANEKVTLGEHRLDVVAPSTLRSVIRRSVRVRAGSDSLGAVMQRSGHEVRDKASNAGSRGHVLELARHGTVLRVMVFVIVQALVRVAARFWSWSGRERVWLRDDTSRR